MKQIESALESKFAELVSDVQACKKCARMCDSERVLGPASGSLKAQAMFIGEAPGRLGADESRIPFHGDKSGHNFESLLDQVGLTRYELFVTNAVLCNPKDEHGNNSTPTSVEIKNCSDFLRRQIELINSPLIVTLGATALKACSLIEEHRLNLKDNVRTSTQWFDRRIIPSYHPGQRAMIHRSFANQLSDYQFIAETVARLGKRVQKKTIGKSKHETRELIKKITEHSGELSYFALHKLFFMIEAKALDELGSRLTDSYIIRQKDGPYCVELHVNKLLSLGLDLSTFNRKGILFIKRDGANTLFDEREIQSTFNLQELCLIDNVLEKYGNLSDSELKRATYNTSVMRSVLRKEKILGMNLFNTPLLIPVNLEEAKE